MMVGTKYTNSLKSPICSSDTQILIGGKKEWKNDDIILLQRERKYILLVYKTFEF